jgi:hypothetical protein
MRSFRVQVTSQAVSVSQMPRNRNPDRDFSAGEERLPHEFDPSIVDPDNWGEPLSYVDLLTHPSVQVRVARLIVQSALKRPRRARRASPRSDGAMSSRG